jgi:receptor expression-enhancing protein 5/6
MTTDNVNYSAEGLQAKSKEILRYVDTELGKFEYANRFERATGVPKSYAALSIAGISFLMIFFNMAGQLLTNSISWIYPGKV